MQGHSEPSKHNNQPSQPTSHRPLTYPRVQYVLQSCIAIPVSHTAACDMVPQCPADSSGVGCVCTCRNKTGPCDDDAICTGTAATCPDNPLLSGVVCRFVRGRINSCESTPLQSKRAGCPRLACLFSCGMLLKQCYVCIVQSVVLLAAIGQICMTPIGQWSNCWGWSPTKQPAFASSGCFSCITHSSDQGA